MLGGRVKFPDDPDIRVRLSDNFSAELGRYDPVEVAEKLAAGGIRLHPSSITRYREGKIAPKLSVARKMAMALNWPLDEAVAGYGDRYARPSLDWGRALLYARGKGFRENARAFFEMFRTIVIRNTHLGFPNDGERRWRQHLRSGRDDIGYACFEIVFNEPVSAGTSVDLIISYCLFEKPRVFSDYGKMIVTSDEVRSIELWTHRSDRACLTASARSFWVATWIDGKAIDFIVRSSRPFAATEMVLEKVLPPEPRAMVRFKPGPIHKYGLAEGGDAESAG